jgi:hypothetical protein
MKNRNKAINVTRLVKQKRNEQFALIFFYYPHCFVIHPQGKRGKVIKIKTVVK